MSPSLRTLRILSWFVAIPTGLIAGSIVMLLANGALFTLWPGLDPTYVGSEPGLIDYHAGPSILLIATPIIIVEMVAWMAVSWRLMCWLQRFMLAGQTERAVATPSATPHER